jgi:hypothetical protein
LELAVCSINAALEIDIRAFGIVIGSALQSSADEAAGKNATKNSAIKKRKIFFILSRVLYHILDK